MNRRTVLFGLSLPLNDQYQAIQLPLNRLPLCELLAPLRPHLNPARALPLSDQPIKFLHFRTLARRGGLGQQRDRGDTKESYPENFLHDGVWLLNVCKWPNESSSATRRMRRTD